MPRRHCSTSLPSRRTSSWSAQRIRSKRRGTRSHGAKCRGRGRARDEVSGQSACSRHLVAAIGLYRRLVRSVGLSPPRVARAVGGRRVPFFSSSRNECNCPYEYSWIAALLMSVRSKRRANLPATPVDVEKTDTSRMCQNASAPPHARSVATSTHRGL
jgi:hypothetical protein